MTETTPSWLKVGARIHHKTGNPAPKTITKIIDNRVLYDTGGWDFISSLESCYDVTVDESKKTHCPICYP